MEKYISDKNETILRGIYFFKYIFEYIFVTLFFFLGEEVSKRC